MESEAPVLNAMEAEGGRAYSDLTGYRATEALALDYMVPGKSQGEPTAEEERRATPTTLAAVRDAGLLAGYSLPPGRLAFTPEGPAVIMPSTPAPGAPCEPACIYSGNRARPRVALTFDTADVADTGAGPIIEELTRLRTPATFFVCGGWCRRSPELLRTLVRRGFEVASHSDTHQWFTKIPDQQVISELVGTSQAVQDIAGVPVAAYFRPPFGAVDSRVRTLAAQCGYRVVMWSTDTIDWSPTATVEQIVSRATEGVSNGEIILMHTHASLTARALPDIVRRLRERGFELTTLSGVLEP